MDNYVADRGRSLTPDEIEELMARGEITPITEIPFARPTKLPFGMEPRVKSSFRWRTWKGDGK